jgi:pimeloyl-[acyl-carrier protein] methyl ester esterase
MSNDFRSDVMHTEDLHIEVVGDGPPLLLLHGWAMHGGVFAPLLPRLARNFTVHLVDLPGHGRSRDSALPLALGPVFDAITARVPRALWCGWSLGGLFALHAVATRPQAVDGVALLCASPRFVRGDGMQGDSWTYGMSPEIFRDFATGLRTDYRGTLDRFLALEAFGSDDARGELRALRSELFARGEPAAHVLADGLALLETTDLRSVLPSLAMPSLWLAGRRDRLVDPRAMRIAAKLAPMSSFAQIEHGGHAPFLTHADEVAAHLADFFARHSRAGGNPVTFDQTARSLDPRLRGDDDQERTEP